MPAIERDKPSGGTMPLSATDQHTTELDRLLMALSAKTQMEAAKLLGVRQSQISDCKRQGSTVTGNLLEQAIKVGIRREWVKDGELPMQRETSARRCIAGRYCLEVCPALEALQQAARLITSCPHICKACEHGMREP